MKTVLVLALLVAAGGLGLAAAPTATACVPYSVCWATHAATCTLEEEDKLGTLDECWAPLP